MRQTHEKIADGIWRQRESTLTDLCDVEREAYVESEFGQSTSEGTGYVTRNVSCRVTQVSAQETTSLGLQAENLNVWIALPNVEGIMATDTINVRECRLEHLLGRYEIVNLNAMSSGMRALASRKG